MTDQLAGIVVAGGRSRRMGRDKAALEYDGRPLLPTIIETLRIRCDPILVAARPESPAAQAFRGEIRDVGWVTTEVPDGGPLCGLAVALNELLDTDATAAFVCATDMPLLTAALIDELAAGLTGPDDAVIAYADNRPHPLAGVYRTRCAEVIAEMVDAGERRLLAIGDRLRVREVTVSNPDWVVNVNSPEDLHRLRAS